MSLVIPPIASFAFRGTARELTWYCLEALTPSADGIACILKLLINEYLKYVDVHTRKVSMKVRNAKITYLEEKPICILEKENPFQPIFMPNKCKLLYKIKNI